MKTLLKNYWRIWNKMKFEYSATCEDCGIECTMKSEKKTNYSIKCQCGSEKWIKMESEL